MRLCDMKYSYSKQIYFTLAGIIPPGQCKGDSNGRSPNFFLSSDAV